QWARLRHWVEAARDDRVLAEELEDDAARWTKSPARAPPWSRLRLSLAEDLLRRGSLPLSLEARAFVEAGRRVLHQRRLGLAGAAAAVLMASAAGGVVYVRDARAKDARRTARMEEEVRRRAEVEEQNQKLREAHARIDALVDELKAAPSHAKLGELEQQLED